MSNITVPVKQNYMPDSETFARGLRGRQARGRVWKTFFLLSNVVALLALLALFLNVIDGAFGYVASTFDVHPNTIVEGGDVAALPSEELVEVIQQYVPNRILVLLRDNASVVPAADFTTLPISAVLAGKSYSEAVADKTVRELTAEEQIEVLSANVSHDILLQFVNDSIVGENIDEVYPLFQSLFDRAGIEADVAAEHPEANLYFRSWVRPSFLSTPQASNAAFAGVRTALLGSIWIMALTILVAFPIGVGAAIYLEEYADPNKPFNRIIETNIRNLAGVPSIIYGLLGLAIFVRAIGSITSGSFLGILDSNGRTIFSAALTMALLILPVIIINAQEAIRAVPSSIREASYGLGATKWQTIWNQVLPAAAPGILTGAILGMSRAIGETAPLVVIGASTTIFLDPNSPFSKFTALPIQIYQWTSRPQAEFRAVAAAAIVVLMSLLLFLNASAIILRQYFRRKLQG